MKRILAFLLLAATLAAFAGCASYSTKGFERTDEVTDTVCIKVEDYGAIVVRLQPEYAPITVGNFQALVGDGFYNGLVFHRVINGFMIQGGRGTSSDGKSPATIKGEFANNGVTTNTLKHLRGTISMARIGGLNNSASSQFFICQEDCPVLDGDYAAFGTVLSGMKVVDKIAAIKTDTGDCPVEDVVISEIYFLTEK